MHALYFAVDQSAEGSHGKLYILNAIRLNQYVLGEEGFGVCSKDDFHVTIRAEMATTPHWKQLLKKKSISEHHQFPDFLVNKQDLQEHLLRGFLRNAPICLVHPICFKN